ncbi:MAG: hypothetical protein RL204_143 [Bacteroidota bacterium]|jgi:hypothetical protein
MIRSFLIVVVFAMFGGNTLSGQGNFIFSHELIDGSINVNVEFTYVNSTDSSVYFYSFSNPIDSSRGNGVYYLNGVANFEGYFSGDNRNEIRKSLNYSSEYLPVNYCSFDTIVITPGESVRIIQKYRARIPEKGRKVRYKLKVNCELYHTAQDDSTICENYSKYMGDSKFTSNRSGTFVGNYDVSFAYSKTSTVRKEVEGLNYKKMRN